MNKRTKFGAEIINYAYVYVGFVTWLWMCLCLNIIIWCLCFCGFSLLTIAIIEAIIDQLIRLKQVQAEHCLVKSVHNI